MHLENPTLHVGPGFYYPEKIPPCLFTFNRISSTGSAVCISITHLCRSDPDFTILLFYYFTILLFYYFTILLFYYFTILLFYYFTILLFYYFTILLILREIGSLHLENPPVPVGPRNYRFTDFARNPEKIPPCLFTFNRISSTGSAVCISKTDPDFTILLFYYFSIFTGNREFASPTLHVGPGFYYPEKILPVSLLLIGFPPPAQQFASRKPTCAGPTQIYYFTILLFY